MPIRRKKKTVKRKTSFFTKLHRNASVKAKRKKVLAEERKLKKARAAYKQTVKKVTKRLKKK